MVFFCAAYNCKERRTKGGLYTFHCFPKDPQKRKAWIIALRRENYIPSDHARLCSKHFTDDCFDTERLGGLRYLKPNAVPTLFDFPPHLHKRPTIIKLPEKVDPPSVTLQPTDAAVSENEGAVGLPNLFPENDNKSAVLLFVSPRANDSNSAVIFSVAPHESDNNAIVFSVASTAESGNALAFSDSSPERESAPCSYRDSSSLPVQRKRFKYFDDCVEDFNDPIVAKKNWDVAIEQVLKSTRESNTNNAVVFSVLTPESESKNAVATSDSSPENESALCTYQNTSSLPEEPVKKKRKIIRYRYFGDCIADFANPVVCKKNWDIAVKQVLKYKKRTKAALQRCRRLEKRVANLKAMLSFLKDDD